MWCGRDPPREKIGELHRRRNARDDARDGAAQDGQGAHHRNRDDTEDHRVLGHRLAVLVPKLGEKAIQVLDQGDSPPLECLSSSSTWGRVAREQCVGAVAESLRSGYRTPPNGDARYAVLTPRVEPSRESGY